MGYADALHIPIDLFFMPDPEKGRTGSSGVNGGFLRRLLYVVVQSAAQATRCRVMAAEDL